MSQINYDDLCIVFQPIYTVATGNFYAAEVLLRSKKDGIHTSPEQLIAKAEEEGNISKIDEIVFQKACKFLYSNQITTDFIHYLEINASVKSLENSRMSDRYIQIMQKYEIDPHMINIEITETVSIDDILAIKENMEKLRKVGVTFSLDDFGSGARSIDDIKELPVDIVKFDATITNVFCISDRMYNIILMIIKMIHELGKKIVAEGIEDKQMFEKSDDARIDYIQGYYLSKPLSEKDYLNFLKNNFHEPL